MIDDAASQAIRDLLLQIAPQQQEMTEALPISATRVNDSAQGRKQIRHPLYFVDDHQFPGLTLEEFYRISKNPPVLRGLCIKVNGRSGICNL